MAATQKIHSILTKYFMCIYQGHYVIYLQNMKFLQSILSLGEAYTDATYANATKIMIPYSDEIMNHDYIGSLACMPNESKTSLSQSMGGGGYVLWTLKSGRFHMNVTVQTLGAIGPTIWGRWPTLIINVCNVNLLLFLNSIVFRCFLNWLSNCFQCQMECGEREFQCYRYGFSPLLTPNRYCSHLLMTFWITFPFYLNLIIVGLIYVH